MRRIWFFLLRLLFIYDIIKIVFNNMQSGEQPSNIVVLLTILLAINLTQEDKNNEHYTRF
jgi:hypothetical protein